MSQMFSAECHAHFFNMNQIPTPKKSMLIMHRYYFKDSKASIGMKFQVRLKILDLLRSREKRQALRALAIMYISDVFCRISRTLLQYESDFNFKEKHVKSYSSQRYVGWSL